MIRAPITLKLHRHEVAMLRDLLAERVDKLKPGNVRHRTMYSTILDQLADALDQRTDATRAEDLLNQIITEPFERQFTLMRSMVVRHPGMMQTAAFSEWVGANLSHLAKRPDVDVGFDESGNVDAEIRRTVAKFINQGKLE